MSVREDSTTNRYPEIEDERETPREGALAAIVRSILLRHKHRSESRQEPDSRERPSDG